MTESSFQQAPRSPTFLVIGVPKAGTTSVYFYLRQHPQIYLSPVKELAFFRFEGGQPTWNGPQHRGYATIDELTSGERSIDARSNPDIWWSATAHSWQDYLRFFDGATDEIAIGEVTPFNFFNERACKRIAHYLPDVRLICILRQPVDRGLSLFMNARRVGLEPLDDFVAAYRDCERRRQAGWMPFLSEYETNGYYIRSLQNYWQHFDRDQLSLYLYDDLRADPIAMMQDIYRFIGVDPTFVPDVSRIFNPTINWRSRHIKRLMASKHPVLSKLKKLTPVKLRQAVIEMNQSRIELPHTVHQALTAEYVEEIRMLEAMIDRDLSSWTSTG